MGRWRYPYLTTCALLLASGGVLLAVKLSGLDALRLTRDTTTTAGLTPWTGFFSTLGLLATAASIGVCALTGATLRRRGDGRSSFFLATAALLGYVLIDDAYLVHDYLAPEVLGLSQKLVYAGIAGAAALWAVRFWADIVEPGMGLFALAAAASGGSLLIDVAGGQPPLVEDWLKFAGIGALTMWCFGRALVTLDPVELRAFDATGDERSEITAAPADDALEAVATLPA